MFRATWRVSCRQVDPSIGGFTSAATLSLSGAIASAVNATVRQHERDVLIFGGEVGPHNGGSVPYPPIPSRVSIAPTVAHADGFGCLGLVRGGF
jgi:hypothetical protein